MLVLLTTGDWRELRIKYQSPERTFVCEDCGIVIDRDLNASINLKMYTERESAKYVNTLSSSGINGRGDAKVHKLVMA